MKRNKKISLPETFNNLADEIHEYFERFKEFITEPNVMSNKAINDYGEINDSEHTFVWSDYRYSEHNSLTIWIDYNEKMVLATLEVSKDDKYPQVRSFVSPATTSRLMSYLTKDLPLGEWKNKDE